LYAATPPLSRSRRWPAHAGRICRKFKSPHCAHRVKRTTSANVIHRHYKALVKKAEAKEFWEITPATVKSKIATLPDEAAA